MYQDPERLINFLKKAEAQIKRYQVGYCISWARELEPAIELIESGTLLHETMTNDVFVSIIGTIKTILLAVDMREVLEPGIGKFGTDLLKEAFNTVVSKMFLNSLKAIQAFVANDQEAKANTDIERDINIVITVLDLNIIPEQELIAAKDLLEKLDIEIEKVANDNSPLKKLVGKLMPLQLPYVPVKDTQYFGSTNFNVQVMQALCRYLPKNAQASISASCGLNKEMVDIAQQNLRANLRI